MADYDIGEAFRRIEEIMIESMARNLRHHINLEQDEGINYTQWQAEQLAALRSFQQQNKGLFKDYFSTIDDQIDEVLRRAYSVGGMEQETGILEALKKGWQPERTAGSTVGGEFFRKNDRKLNALIKATRQDIQRAETAMLRTADDRYRKIIFNSHVRYQSGAGTLAQCVDMATKDFLSQGINCIEYADGKRVGIDAYAAMALRTAHTRAYLQGEAAKRDEWGINTVIVNKRGVACPRCLKYVGRVFYDDVWGTVPIKDSKYPRLSEAISGGLYHPNCKDIHTTYFEGVNTPPQPMTAEQKKEARRVYELEQEQRYNERQIRHWKRLESSSVYPENQAKYKQHRENWQERQRQFISDNGDVLKRRYENERYTGMKLPEPPKYREMMLKDSGKGGIIQSEDYQLIEITDETIAAVPTPTISLLSDEQNGLLADNCRGLLQMLKYRECGTEAFATCSLKAELLHMVFGEDGDLSVNGIRESVPYISIHNHPSGLTFSPQDIRLFANDDNMLILVVVGNDGSLYVLEKTASFDEMGLNAALVKIRTIDVSTAEGAAEYIRATEDLLKEVSQYGLRYSFSKA